jgi:hypothetical protein
MSIKGIPEPSLIDEDRKRAGTVNWLLSAAADGLLILLRTPDCKRFPGGLATGSYIREKNEAHRQLEDQNGWTISRPPFAVTCISILSILLGPKPHFVPKLARLEP